MLTSPPARVNRTLPSPNPAFTTPVCRLRYLISAPTPTES